MRSPLFRLDFFFGMRKNFVSAITAKTIKNSRFVDCRWSLKEPATYGLAEYAKGHLPDAVFANMDLELSAPFGPGTGRHPLPRLEDFGQWLKSKGLGKELSIICYDDFGGSMAARLWWMLRCVGYPDATILDGGIQAWQHEGLPLVTAPPSITALDALSLPESWEGGHMPILSVDQMVANLTDPKVQVVDARPAPRYGSKADAPVWPDPVAGHYPGAANWPAGSNLTEDKQLRSEDELRALAGPALGDKKATEVAFSCGSGVTACLDIAVAEHVGMGTPALYVGSWSQWCTVHPDKVECSP